MLDTAVLLLSSTWPVGRKMAAQQWDKQLQDAQNLRWVERESARELHAIARLDKQRRRALAAGWGSANEPSAVADEERVVWMAGMEPGATAQQLVEACAPFGQVMACVLRPSGSSCSMWGLVGFKQADQADRLLGVKTPLRLADSFLVAHRSNLF